MKYNDYIDSINPPLELKEKIYSAVNKEAVKKQINRSKKIKGTITVAACFAIIVGTTFVINNSSKSENQSKLIGSVEKDNDSLVQIAEAGNDKSLPQELIINNAYYRQFSSNEVKGQLQKENGNYVIKKSDIGDFVCNINSNNIYNMDKQKTENDENAKQNEFYNAKVYYYLPCNDLSNIVVETKENFYLFHIVDLNNSVGITEMLDFFSVDKNNHVDSIEIWQDETVNRPPQEDDKVVYSIQHWQENTVSDNFFELQGEATSGLTVKEVMRNSIKDKNDIKAIIKYLSMAKPVKNGNKDEIYFDIHRNEIDESMTDTDQYRLVFKLSNGLSFELFICKDSKYIQALESTYFESDKSTINELVKLIS